MSRFGHRSSGSSQRAAGDALSRAQRTAIPKRQDTSAGARFRGLPFSCPEHLLSCPEPLRFRGKATLLNAEVFPRGRNARTRSPLSPQRSPFPGSAASFRLGTLLVHALASAHPSDAEILPTDVCHPIYILSSHLHPRSVARTISGLAPGSFPRNPPVHAGESALAGPLVPAGGLFAHRPLAIFASDVSVATSVRSPRPPSRACPFRDRLGRFRGHGRDAMPAFST